MPTPWYDYPTSNPFAWTGPGSIGHNGYDIATPYHTPITDLFAGVVSYVGVQPGVNGSPGAEVEVQTRDPQYGNVTDLYLHLDKIAPGLKVGDHVEPGDLLGYSGGETIQQVQADPAEYPDAEHPVINTSYTYSTGAHTHFGIFRGQTGLGMDAWDYINSFADPAPDIALARGGSLPSGSAAGVVNQVQTGGGGTALQALPAGLQAVLSAIGIPKLPPWQDILGVIIGGAMVIAGVIVVLASLIQPAAKEAAPVVESAAKVAAVA